MTNTISHTPQARGLVEVPVAESLRPRIGAAVPPETTPNVRQIRPIGTDESKLREVVAVVESHVSTLQRSLAFEVDQRTGRTVVTVSDRESGEIIRQIPAAEALALAARLQEATEGFLLAEEA